MRQQPNTYGMAPANMSSVSSSWQDNSRQMTKGTPTLTVSVQPHHQQSTTKII